MFRLKKIVLFSRNFFELPAIVKHRENAIRRILPPSSGCLIAGCCFSRQSDEEPILDNVKDNSEDLLKIQKNNRSHSNSDFHQQHASTSKTMKRSFESINDGIIDNANNCESPLLIPGVYCKRKKTDATETGATPDEHIRPELSDTECDPSNHTTIKDGSRNYNEAAKSEKEKPKKQRPNYFVAVRVSDPQIHQSLKELQTHILQKDERLKRIMIELKTLHITLMVTYIGDAETHARAMKALENIHQEHDEAMSRNPIKLEFQGLSHFQNRVLYATLLTNESSERLQSLAESVKKHFAAASVFSTDTRQGFTPHLTVAKIDFKKKHNKFIKKIDPSLYKDFSSQYFGSQKIISIQLLKMMGPKDEDGYYSGNEIYFSAFTPNAKLSSLNKMLETEEKKKNIKEVINALMKEKLT